MLIENVKGKIWFNLNDMRTPKPHKKRSSYNYNCNE